MGSLLMLVWLAAGDASPAAEGCPEYRAALAEGEEREASFDDLAAAAAYRHALLLDPEAVEARIGLARALNAIGEAEAGPEAAGRFERARRLAEGLRELRPDEPDGHYWVAASLGNLVSLRDGPEKVRLAREIDAAARRALSIDPCFAPAYVVLGISYRELSGLGWFVRGIAGGLFGGLPKGGIEDAERLLRLAVDLDPDDPFARYQLALTLERRKRPREAMAQLREAIDRPPRAVRDVRLQAEAMGRLARLAVENPWPVRLDRP